METKLIKLKRHRRTKKEMEEYRASLIKKAEPTDAEWKEAHKDIDKPKKKAQKSNLEAEHPILEARYVEYVEGKVIEGWVNVYKDGKSYWLGSDIHYTIEDARRVSGAIKARQIKVSFEGF